MPSPRTRQQRRVVAQLMLDCARLLAQSLFQDGEQFGSLADDTMLCLAIYIGQAEGRMMTALKLSDYVGIPRATVVRKITELRKRGLVSTQDGRTYCLTHKVLGVDRVSSEIVKRIRVAYVELSSLDSQPVAAR